MFSLALNLVGATAVAWSLVRTHSDDRAAWVLGVALVSVLVWAMRAVFTAVGLRNAALVAALVSMAAGAVTIAPTDGLAIVPTAVGALVVVGDPSRSLWLGVGSVIGAGFLVVIGAVPFGSPVPGVVAALGGLLLATFAALSRRQFRRSGEQEALLRERDLTMREEAARVSIARDLHDVLAHSLGGLVIQLDAVDALLEAGEQETARQKVVAARALAAEGLAEARRAVAVLRDPRAAASEDTIAPDDVITALSDLLAAHRGLGGTVSFEVHGDPRTLSGAQSMALQRALQEALSNARKHAPGEASLAQFRWQTDRVRLTVSTPLSAPLFGPTTSASRNELAASGGGHGLDGMRERFDALPGGGSVEIRRRDGRFTVIAEARLL